MQEYEYIGLVVHKTAQVVYDEWLESKDKPLPPVPSEMEILQHELTDAHMYITELELSLFELQAEVRELHK